MLPAFGTCNLCKTTVRITSQTSDLLGQEIAASCRENYLWPLTAKRWPARANAWARWHGCKSVQESASISWYLKSSHMSNQRHPQTESSMLFSFRLFPGTSCGQVSSPSLNSIGSSSNELSLSGLCEAIPGKIKTSHISSLYVTLETISCQFVPLSNCCAINHQSNWLVHDCFTN